MAYLGDFDMGTTLYTKFTTVNASGVPTELSAPAAGFFVNSNTTVFISGGISCETGWNSTTGLNHAQMILTTSATGMTTGSSYQLALTTGTVSGVNLKGLVFAEFSIRKRSALMPITPGQQVAVDANGIVAANVTAASINIGAVVTAANTNIGAIVTASSINIGAIVTVANTNIGAIVTASSINIGAIVTACNTIVPARVTAQGIDIGAIVTAVNTIVPARVTAQGIDIGAIVTAVNTIVPARVTAQGIDVGAIVTAINTIADANVTSFSASGLAYLFLTDSGTNYAASVVGSPVKEIADNAGGSTLSATAVASVVWDTTSSAHQTQGTFGQTIGDSGADATTLYANVTAIKSKTSGLTFTSSGEVDANIHSVANVSVTGFGTVASPWGP